MINKPYVKEYDENGVVTNPINGNYLNVHANRRSRRSGVTVDKFYGESKNTHLSVTPNSKYYRFRQAIKLKDADGNYTGKIKYIEHYLSNNPCKSRS